MVTPHPVWDILRSFIVLGWVTLMLYICATEFDATEWKAIGGISVGLFASEGWRKIQEYRDANEQKKKVSTSDSNKADDQGEGGT